MFSQASFATASFSPTSFFFGIQEESASSGVRRLQLYQLQEEALKTGFKQAIKTVVEEANEQEQGQTTPPRARKTKARKPAMVAREEYPEVRFKRKPIYTQPTDLNTTLPVWLALVSKEVDQWYASLIPLWEEHRRVIIKTQTAANDAEYRIRLLLLAA